MKVLYKQYYWFNIGDVRIQARVLIQVFNVGGIKFIDKWLILPTAKLSSTPIFLAIYSQLLSLPYNISDMYMLDGLWVCMFLLLVYHHSVSLVRIIVSYAYPGLSLQRITIYQYSMLISWVHYRDTWRWSYMHCGTLYVTG